MIVDDRVIRDELAKHGIRISGVYDLVNSKAKYPEAIPTLIDLLQYDFYDQNLKEGIVRALTVKEAIGLANKPLLKLYEDTPKNEIYFVGRLEMPSQ